MGRSGSSCSGHRRLSRCSGCAPGCEGAAGAPGGSRRADEAPLSNRVEGTCATAAFSGRGKRQCAYAAPPTSAAKISTARRIRQHDRALNGLSGSSRRRLLEASEGAGLGEDQARGVRVGVWRRTGARIAGRPRRARHRPHPPAKWLGPRRLSSHAGPPACGPSRLAWPYPGLPARLLGRRASALNWAQRQPS